jgi:hypothetical protein
MPVFAQRDLRTLCRDTGVPVSFGSVSTYPDDGQPVMGIFDRPVGMKLAAEGIGGVENAAPELRLPFNAFSAMPQAGDAVTVDGVSYTVYQPTTEDDGAFLCYELKATS